MAIENFIPEIWTAQLLHHLRAALVFGQAGLTNRNYEGDIAQAGGTVHITQIGDPSISDYDRDTPLTYEQLDDDTRALVIDQAKSFSFAVDDIEKRQALPGFVGEATANAGYGLAFAADAFISAEMASGCDTSNQLGAITVATADEGYELLVELRKRLVESNAPNPGRWVAVPPAFYAALLKDDRFVKMQDAGTTDGLRNGQVGRAAGFDVFESNTCPGGDTVIAGSPVACTYAEQINEVEALRLIDSIGDGIRGLHLYGAKVVQPKALATAVVTVDPS